jgi:hypothetical protein
MNEGCETKKRPRFVIDDAPGKELIAKLSISADPDLLKSFFAERLIWCGGYPLIHDRFVTYGAFDDLIVNLSLIARHQLIPNALEIIESAPDQFFHAALFFLTDMIPDDAMYERPTNFSDRLLRLRLRAEKFSFLPNLECAWDSLVRKSYYLRMSENDFLREYTPRELAISSDAWRRFFPFPLINHAVTSLHKCKADSGKLKQHFKELGSMPGDRRLIYATRVQETWYWVWKIPGKAGIAHLARLVFLRQPATGTLGIGYWDIYRQFNERYKPEEISRHLLKIEFYPTDELREVQPNIITRNDVHIQPDIEVVFVQFDGAWERDIHCAEMLSRIVKEYLGVRLTIIDYNQADGKELQRIAV